ncbi:DNA-binding protein RHL1 isoform X7 [Olea europaea var. sylvestris]|uniref:DNA-binding protein RHL1 isoform X7 n=1 Tax=Olea europaea var. sylvestris TaxID=158386 RepID=UPI000C1CE0C5|nr:DNA-binding protein RHL1 isoform X7 [Olea europaea var. sylvestris]
MGRDVKKEEKAVASNPDVEERKRLKKLAFSKTILSEHPSRVGPSSALAPSKIVTKHHGTDILKKSQRKNRFLFSFPGLLGLISGGKIGELKDLGTRNPILYLDFPQGQLKLFGTIFYPKNRYLTLQFSRGGKSVMCEDYFDNMIVFSDAWWIGKKDENPEELCLEFPKDLNLEQHAEYDFKGGAGAPCDGRRGFIKSAMKCVEQDSPQDSLEDDLTDSQNNVKESIEVTPTRHSARTAGKTFKFAETSSGDDFVGTDAETFEEEDEEVDVIEKKGNCTSIKTEHSCPVVFDIDNVDATEPIPASDHVKRTAKSKDLSHNNHVSLVQTSVSTLFKNLEEKSTSSIEVYQRKSESKTQGASSSRKRRADPVPASNLSDPSSSPRVEDDDIEEFSSTSQDMNASDGDWTA